MMPSSVPHPEVAPVPRDVLHLWATKVLTRQGMFAAESPWLIDQLSRSQHGRNGQWGWARFPRIVHDFELGNCDPRAHMLREHSATGGLMLNAGTGSGLVASRWAIEALGACAHAGNATRIDVVNCGAGCEPRSLLAALESTPERPGWIGYATRPVDWCERSRPSVVTQICWGASPANEAQVRQLDEAFRARVVSADGEWVQATSSLSLHSAASTTLLLPAIATTTLLLPQPVLDSLHAMAAAQRISLLL